MVATREEQRLKRREQRQFTPPHPMRTRMPLRSAAGTPLAEQAAGEYLVIAYRDGRVLARHVDGTAADLTFVVPGGSELATLDAAVRFLRRRGPDYLPATPLRITLDSRGRARDTERV